MGSHVTAVFAPLAAGDVPVQGQVAVPVRGRVDPALPPAPGPGVVALTGKINDRTLWVAVDALAGAATARAATAAPAAMMIVRLQIFMVSPRVVSSDPYYLEIPGKFIYVA